MSVYFQATIEVRAEGFSRFLETMERVLPLAEAAGWQLVGAYIQTTGRLHTVIDVWELEDFNHFGKGLEALRTSPEYESIGPALAETIERETIVFMQTAPYSRRAKTHHS